MNINDKYDYSVFVDMVKESYKNNKKDLFYSQLALLYFDSGNDISLKTILNKIIKLAKWTLTKPIPWDLYW